jgi:Flp pilus assembly protein TadG
MGLVLPLLLLVVLGIMDFGTLFQRYEVLTNAAREGARVAVLPDYQTNLDANVDQRVLQYISTSFLGDAAAITAADITVTPTTAALPGGGPCITTMTVTVAYPFTFRFLPGISLGVIPNSRTLTVSSSMRSEAVLGTCP